jgi:hypothetical protein
VTQIQRRYTALAAQLCRLRQQFGAIRKDYADLLDDPVDRSVSLVLDQVERDLLNMEQVIAARMVVDGASPTASPTGDGHANQ